MVDLVRAAIIDYRIIAGDTFAPGPVSFTIDGQPENFSGASIIMQVKQSGRLFKQIANGSGITVSVNTLQYVIQASDMANLPAGMYEYDVQKTVSSVVSTIQKGTITIIKDITR